MRRRDPRVRVAETSFGGKVGALYARDHAVELDELWLVDAPLGVIDGAGDHESAREIRDVMAALRAVPTPLSSRGALVPMLTARGLVP